MSTLLEQKSYGWRKNCACFIQMSTLPTSSIANTPSSDPSSPYPPTARLPPATPLALPPTAGLSPTDSPARVECVPLPPLAGGGWGAGVKNVGGGIKTDRGRDPNGDKQRLAIPTSQVVILRAGGGSIRWNGWVAR
jgi:hypothetical protein